MHWTATNPHRLKPVPLGSGRWPALFGFPKTVSVPGSNTTPVRPLRVKILKLGWSAGCKGCPICQQNPTG
jgi:hypothetical protein